MNKNSLVELLTEERMNTALEQALKTNESYQNWNRKIESQERKIDKMRLNKIQRIAVDRLISAYNANAAEYGRAAYEQGFKDCLILMRELSQLEKNI